MEVSRGLEDLGRIMSLDIGDRRTGIAVTDPSRTIVSPHLVVEESSRARTIAVILREIEALSPVLIVSGIPLDRHGEDTDQARRVRNFVALLAEETAVPIVFQDESYTTAMAEETLALAQPNRKKWKNSVDMLAAAEILQAWLHSQHHQQQISQQQQSAGLSPQGLPE